MSFLLTEEFSNKEELNKILIYHREFELNHLNLLNSIKLNHENSIMEFRSHYELKQQNLKNHFHKLFKSKREEIEINKKNEISFLEAKKLNLINLLLIQNKKEIDELKKYFSDIINSNLELIKNLREEVGDMKKKEFSVNKKISTIKKSNELLNGPLKQKNDLLEAGKIKYNSYLNDKKLMKSFYLQLEEINKKITDKKWEKELLKQKFELIKKNKNIKNSNFIKLKFSLLQKAKFSELIEINQIKQFQTEIEKLEIAINELLLTTEIEPTTVGIVNKGLENLLMEKNSDIMKLEDSIQEQRQQYSTMIQELNKTLELYNIPKQELGFIPKQTLN